MQSPTSATTQAILVIDDELGLRKAVGRSLERIGFTCSEADSAEAGLKVVLAEVLACVLVDLRMPGMGGHGFIRSCRQVRPDLPIVVMSGAGDMDDLVECLRAGVTDFIAKPWSNAELCSIIKRAVETKTLQLAAVPTAAPAIIASVAVVAPVVAPAVSVPLAPVPKQSVRLVLANIVEQIRTGGLKLPAAPSVALEVRQLISNNDCTVDQIKHVVERDGYMAGRIISLANSAHYGGSAKATDLKMAIGRIGLKEVSNLVCTIVAQDFYSVKNAVAQRDIKAIWEHSLGRAIAARLLAQESRSSGVIPDQAYLAGLFCDMGGAFLFKVMAESAPDLAHLELCAFVAQHHVMLGASIAQAWKLPNECIEAIRMHHDESPFQTAQPIVQLMSASEGICAAINIAGDPGEIHSANEAFAMLIPSQTARVRLCARTKETLEKQRPALT